MSTTRLTRRWVNLYLDKHERVGVDFMLGSYEPPTDIASYMLGAGQVTFDKSSKKSFAKAKGIQIPVWPVMHDHDVSFRRREISRDAAITRRHRHRVHRALGAAVQHGAGGAGGVK